MKMPTHDSRPSGNVAVIPVTEHAASQIADAMFALSAPSRVQIVSCLLDGPLHVGEITALLGMEQSAVSHQLRVLREAGLVTAERHGKRRVYTIPSDAVRELLTAAWHLAGVGQPAGERHPGHDARGETTA
jgi:ArsR family transcriptional regulator, nickel/cobalt-responsive transcriptional repressor